MKNSTVEWQGGKINVFKNKKMLMVLTGVLIAGLMLAGCGQAASTGQSGKEPYKIGAVFDTSGPASSLGVPERDTAQMVVDEINNSGGVTKDVLVLVEVKDGKWSLVK